MANGRRVWLEVIAFDPGGTTGWAWVRVPGDRRGTVASMVQGPTAKIQSGEFSGDEMGQCQEILELVDTFPDAAVCSERFTLRKFNQNKEFLAPVRLNAVLQFHCWSVGREVHWQDPGTAMQRWTDERLKEVGLHKQARYVKNGGGPHATDALRHALTLITRCLSDEFLYGRVAS